MSAGRTMLFSVMAAGLIAPASARALEVWQADLTVQLSASEDVAAGTITHDVVVTNIGDDTGRELVITHIPIPGTRIRSYVAGRSSCAVVQYVPPNGPEVLRCTLATLDVRATETIQVVTTNAVHPAIRRRTTAQAMAASPDGKGNDNVAHLDVP